MTGSRPSGRGGVNAQPHFRKGRGAGRADFDGEPFPVSARWRASKVEALDSRSRASLGFPRAFTALRARADRMSALPGGSAVLPEPVSEVRRLGEIE